ncbi:hypothetical protein Y1Q_0007428 [Alligator mississippiensis]|uniref:ribonuclease H n=1 Tax=Alligator mississippiensis TaxID=8496 RepID=A0A151P8A8_ALLMI|nr:hypothetical protein Y1Q_0007428 [Alligator mississippiensis]
MKEPDLATYASMQATAISPADVLGQNLQALTQILNSQQQMLDRQQDWLQHSLVSFKMPKMTKDNDPEVYIEAFERHALMTRLDKRYWASQLGALVVGKAQATYRAFSRDDAQDYKHVKEAILYRLEINSEHYCRQFRAKKGPEAKQPRVLQLLWDLLDKRLNAMEVFDAFPMPHVAELVERIGDARYISTLDLAKGYWQIPVAKEDRLKTAFGTLWGLYEFIRMPFGLHGAAATFQRLMDQILAPHAKYAAAYIDNIVIYSRTWEQHKSALRAILTELRHAGLTANPRKCVLAQKETKYLGFLVSRGTIKPLADKMDASETAVGAVLTQEEGENERPVAYASRKLLPAEKRYATIEHECLAIQWAVDHFRYYLMGREFKLIGGLVGLFMVGQSPRNAKPVTTPVKGS